jgi:hypothetical protein
MLEERMARVLQQFQKKFFEYVAVFYEQSKVEFCSESYLVGELRGSAKTYEETDKSVSVVDSKMLHSQKEVLTAK